MASIDASGEESLWPNRRPPFGRGRGSAPDPNNPVVQKVSLWVYFSLSSNALIKYIFAYASVSYNLSPPSS